MNRRPPEGSFLDDLAPQPSRFQELRQAILAKRLLNLLIDPVASVWVIVIVLPCSFILEKFIDFEIARFLMRNFGLALYLVGVLLNYIVMEKLTGQSIGKFFTHTRVVNQYGEPISWGQAVRRFAIRLIPIEPYSLLFSMDDRPWHDRWTNTYVVENE